MPVALDVPQRDLTIYLLKDHIKDTSDALRNMSRLKAFTISATGGASTIGQLFVKLPRGHPPRWAAFFEGYIDPSELGRVSATSAVMLIRTRTRLLAITFGQGRFLLVPDCWEERFGLRVALNSIEPDKLRSLDKRTFDAISTHSRVQGSREGSAPDFGLDVEQDLVRAVTGKPNDETLGKRLSGMDALHTAVRVRVADIKPLLRTYLAKNADDSYKRQFPWIDQIAEISDKSLVDRLDAQLVENIKGARDRCWLCVPEIIDWGRTGGFRYAFGARAPEYQDLSFDDFLESVDTAEIDVALLRRRHASQIDNEGNTLEEWPIYRCIYCELELDGRTYILSTGRWYRIDRAFVKTVDEFFEALPRYATRLPEFDDASEGAYCTRVAAAFPAQYALMDQKPIPIGGAHGKVEFCDLFTSGKDLIHIKRYGASSVLSHLFSQGVVSGEAFRGEASFRAGALDRLPPSHRTFGDANAPQPGEFQIVFAIISDKTAPLTLPFFSRVNLRQASRRLERSGYRVALAKIQVADVRAKLKKYAPR